VYLPRNYQHIVSIRLKDAQFPPVINYPGATSALTATGIVQASGYATVNVGSTTGFTAGNTVVIAGTTTAKYDGTFIIQSVPTGTTFTIKTAITGGQASATGTATVISPGAATHSYMGSIGSRGDNIASSTFTGDTLITTPTYYFLIGLEGLNKVDETAVGANRSTFSDSFFAKIPATTTTYGATSFIDYHDHSALENVSTYSPPIENLDRLRLTVRTHAQQDKSGFMYWTSDGGVATASNTGGAANFNLTLEIEYMENAFTDFSSFETRLAQRS
jgi:hypothetical protein